MAGLSCAETLVRAGFQVRLFDKGRGPGGRMASRRLETSAGPSVFDFGAQYFTVRDAAFAQQVRLWEAKGVVTPWPLARHDAYVGVPTMKAVLRDLADRHDVSFSTLVKGVTRHGNKWHLVCDGPEQGPFDGVVLALPAEQTAPILTLHDFELAKAALFARSQPCWTGMFVFDQPLDTADDIMRDRGVITWASRNNAKPGRSGPESWVVQAAPQWSVSHLEHAPETIAPHLLQALAVEIGSPIPHPIAQSIHRWRYALSAGTGLGSLWNAQLQIGACGDWLLGPRIECAWLSGQNLAERMVAAPSIAAE
jgi:predicted NAD/FAD-dependent oxidoreductase